MFRYRNILNLKDPKKLVAIDFDGCVAPISKNDIIVNESKEKADPVMKRFIRYLYHDAGCTIIISTARILYGRRKETEEWLRKNEIPYHALTFLKLPALAFIDDKALRFVADPDVNVFYKEHVLYTDALNLINNEWTKFKSNVSSHIDKY